MTVHSGAHTVGSHAAQPDKHTCFSNPEHYGYAHPNPGSCSRKRVLQGVTESV